MVAPRLMADENTLEDAVYLALLNAEQCLLTAGARPRVDYTWSDLVALAARLTTVIFNEKGGDWRVPGEPDLAEYQAEIARAAAGSD